MTGEPRNPDRIALVTGASSGIGERISVQLAVDGYAVVLTGRDHGALERVAERVERTGSGAWTVSADLRDDEGIRDVARRVREAAEGLDVLVHSAGQYSRAALTDARADDFRSLFDVNVRARFLLTRELLPHLVESRGQVVFVGSSLARGGARGKVGLYAATMHADRALADALRDEVNADGVRVLSVHLGRTDTRMQREVHAAEGRSYEPEYLMDPETVARMVSACLGLPRDAEVTELSMRPMRKRPHPGDEEPAG